MIELDSFPWRFSLWLSPQGDQPEDIIQSPLWQNGVFLDHNDWTIWIPFPLTPPSSNLFWRQHHGFLSLSDCKQNPSNILKRLNLRSVLKVSSFNDWPWLSYLRLAHSMIKLDLVPWRFSLWLSLRVDIPGFFLHHENWPIWIPSPFPLHPPAVCSGCNIMVSSTSVIAEKIHQTFWNFFL